MGAKSPAAAACAASAAAALTFDTRTELHFLVSVRSEEVERAGPRLYSALKIAPLQPNGSRRRCALRANHGGRNEAPLARHWTAMAREAGAARPRADWATE